MNLEALSKNGTPAALPGHPPLSGSNLDALLAENQEVCSQRDGFLLDQESEEYLLKLAQKRIERMEQQMLEAG